MAEDLPVDTHPAAAGLIGRTAFHFAAILVWARR